MEKVRFYPVTQLDQLVSQGCEFIDNFPSQLEELFLIRNPQSKLMDDFTEQEQSFVQQQLKNNSGTLVYFPWNNKILRILNEDELNEVRTNRNRELITLEEQKKLLGVSIAFLGMSIGSVIARTMVQSGIGKHIVLADHDTFSLSNLNRVPVGLPDIGRKKVEICAQRLYELNPYLNIHSMQDGLNSDQVNTLFQVDPPPQLIIEETDDFVLKIKVRKFAKQHGVPVIMATCLGDSILIDVERFDLDKDVPIFHGLLSESEVTLIENGNISEEEKKMLAIQLVGKENVPLRAVASVKEIGLTLVGRPQLFSSVSIAAGLLTKISSQLFIDGKVKSQRTLFKFEDLISV